MKSSSNFKDKFKELMTEMTALVKEAKHEDLKEVKIDLLKVKSIKDIDNIMCQSDEEFQKRMLECISGVKGDYAYILQHHDELSEERVEQHRKTAKEVNRYFTLPSIINPPTRIGSKAEEYPQTHLVIFMKDKRLLLVPYDGDAFSDIEFDDFDNEVEFIPDF